MKSFSFSEMKNDTCNFADDNTTYHCGSELQKLLENLNWDMKISLKWFRIDFMKANLKKF